MKTSRRLRIREDLRAQVAAKRWRELIDECGSPLLVLDRDQVVERSRPLSALIYAAFGCTSRPPSEVDHVRALGLAMGRCIHTHLGHPAGKESEMAIVRPSRAQNASVTGLLDVDHFRSGRLDVTGSPPEIC